MPQDFINKFFTICFLVLGFYPLSSVALTFDWSGFARTEVHYSQSKDQKLYFSNIHFILKPKLQVLDGLDVFTRIDLHPYIKDENKLNPFSNLVDSPELYPQIGFTILHSDNSQKSALDSLFLNITQLYIQYKTDFFSLRLGRAPYHFGLGVTYSAETNPLDYWSSTFNQISLYLEHSIFYAQPSLLHSSQNLAATLQAGLKKDKWTVEALYHYPLNSLLKKEDSATTQETPTPPIDNLSQRDSFVEVFATYNESSFNSKASITYYLKETADIAFAYAGSVKLPIYFSPSLNLNLAYASKNLSFNPNYERFRISNHNQSSSLEGIKDLLYISPSLTFAVLENTLKATPIFSVYRQLTEKNMYYELDLQVVYQPKEKLSFFFQGGILKRLDKLHYALSAQAVVAF